MKKTFTLILLGGLLFFGVESALATNYLRGSWYDDWNGIQIDDNTDVTVLLGYDTEYTFEIRNSQDDKGDFRRVNTAKYTETGSKSLSAWEGVCTIHTGVAGNYTFKITSWDGSTPTLSITYPDPTDAVTYTIYFDKTDCNWANQDNFAAYIYTYDNKKLSGVWPGRKASLVSGNIYSVSIESLAVPFYVIWNNNNSGSETSRFNFSNNCTYKYDGVKSYTINPTPDGYATFYNHDNKFSVPSGFGVKAYTGTYNSSTNTLTLYELSAGGTYCNIIPADCAVVLHSDNGATAFDVTINNGENAGGIYGGNNLLGKSNITAVSSMAGEIGTGTLCVLGYDVDHAGFYHFGGDNLAANRAYLIVPGATTAPEIHFAYGDATDINAIDATEEVVKFFQDGKLFIKKNGVVYDMMGAVVK